MSEIERYLSELRSHLADLDAERADEIVAEARSHLEDERARLHAAGVGWAEAEAKAVSALGLPGSLGVELSTANHHHRAGHDRDALALLIAFVGFAFAAAFMPGPPSWIWNLDRRLAADTFFVPNQVHALAAVLLSCPLAALIGFFTGRLAPWILGLPPVIFGACLVIVNVLEIVCWRGMLPTDTDDMIVGATLAIVGGPLLAIFGLLGSRLRQRHSSCQLQVE